MRRRAVLLGSIALAGCGSVPVHNYQLAPVPGRISGGAGTHIVVRSIGLPASLSQGNVPKPGGAYEADSFANELWAGNLGGMLQTAMVQNLAQRLPGDAVVAGGGAIGLSADLYVEINILAFSPDASGNVSLQAQLATRHVNAQDWKLRAFSATAAGGITAEGIAAAMSNLWGQAADVVAGMVN
jgi:uncharacterized lipoprotein YmbA